LEETTKAIPRSPATLDLQRRRPHAAMRARARAPATPKREEDDNKKQARSLLRSFRNRIFLKRRSAFLSVAFSFLAFSLLAIYNIPREALLLIRDFRRFNEDSCPDIASLRESVDSKKICFVTSVFATRTRRADHPSNVTSVLDCSRYRFFQFTNLWRLESPGWTKILRYDLGFQYSRMITRSRSPKFMSWRDPRIARTCRTVFYTDGYVVPQLDNPLIVDKIERISRELSSPGPGLAQVRHPTFDGETFEELFQGILLRKKDLPENTNTTFKWLQSQPDYQPRVPYYLNKYFGTYKAQPFARMGRSSSLDRFARASTHPYFLLFCALHAGPFLLFPPRDSVQS